MSLQDAIARNRARQAAKTDAVLSGRHHEALRAFIKAVDGKRLTYARLVQ